MSAVFDGLTFCTAQLPRTLCAKQLTDQITERGGKVVKSVSRKTYRLLISPTAKITNNILKAIEHDIQIIDVAWITRCISCNQWLQPTPEEVLTNKMKALSKNSEDTEMQENTSGFSDAICIAEEDLGFADKRNRVYMPALFTAAPMGSKNPTKRATKRRLGRDVPLAPGSPSSNHKPLANVTNTATLSDTHLSPPRKKLKAGNTSACGSSPADVNTTIGDSESNASSPKSKGFSVSGFLKRGAAVWSATAVLPFSSPKANTNTTIDSKSTRPNNHNKDNDGKQPATTKLNSSLSANSEEPSPLRDHNVGSPGFSCGRPSWGGKPQLSRDEDTTPGSRSRGYGLGTESASRKRQTTKGITGTNTLSSNNHRGARPLVTRPPTITTNRTFTRDKWQQDEGTTDKRGKPRPGSMGGGSTSLHTHKRSLDNSFTSRNTRGACMPPKCSNTKVSYHTTSKGPNSGRRNSGDHNQTTTTHTHTRTRYSFGGNTSTNSGGGGGPHSRPSNLHRDKPSSALSKKPALPTNKKTLPQKDKSGQAKVNTNNRGSSGKQKSLLERVKESSHAQGVDEQSIKQITDMGLVEQTVNVTWDQVTGLKTAKDALNESVVLPSKRPDLYTGLRKPAKGILLFGPPGNGKTLLAKAVASQCNATFFNLSASTLCSKWIGESEKLMRALFAVARALQPSVIFIDEIDSILQTRSSSTEHEASRRLKTEFLVQMDGVTVDSDNNKVLLLGATNRPQDLDDAALRRMTKRIYIAMPDGSTRRAMAERMLKDNNYCFSEDDWEEFITNTKDYSGSDITNLCQDMALQPLRELAPEEAISVSVEDIRAISVEDMRKAVKNIRQSVSPDSLGTMEKWNAQFGCT